MKSSKFNKNNNNNFHQHQNLDVIILDKKPNIVQPSNKKLLTRKQKLAKMHDKIIKSSYPRLEMILLVCFTGLTGFLSSYWLYKFGFTTMWTRYLVSIGVSYMSFIVLLKVWLWCKTSPPISSSNSNGLDNVGEIFDLPYPSGPAPHIPSVDFHGAGGSFDSGGASGHFDADSSGAFGEAIGAAAHAEEAAIPLIVIVTVLFALLSSIIFVFSLVNSAPILFSELLVDGVLSASLYRRLKGIDKYHWLESAVKRTFWPFFWVAVTFMIVGVVVQSFMPQIHSIGELIAVLHKHI